MVEIKTRCRIPIWRTFGRIPWHAIREPPATLQGAVTWRNQCHDRATFFTIFNFLLFFNAVLALTSSGFRIVLFYTGCVFWIILPLCPICFLLLFLYDFVLMPYYCTSQVCLSSFVTLKHYVMLHAWLCFTRDEAGGRQHRRQRCQNRRRTRCPTFRRIWSPDDLRVTWFHRRVSSSTLQQYISNLWINNQCRNASPSWTPAGIGNGSRCSLEM